MIAILHDRIPDDAPPDCADMLVEAQTVARILRRLGKPAVILPVTGDLPGLSDRLAAHAVDLVFNLVECLGGDGRLIHLVPSWLDAIGMPYTGAPSAAIYLTSNKLLAKQQMRAAQIPTPGWTDSRRCAGPPAHMGGAFIIKSVWEHASIGLSRHSLVQPRSERGLQGQIAQAERRIGSECFAEAYIEGREFNLSLLASESGPQVLPPAEAIFYGYAPDEPKIIDYEEKWGAVERAGRRFRFPKKDRALIDRLSGIALQCWECFGLRGYARVDFRVDHEGQPWVLEVNTNPCLSPDGGFTATVKRAGLTMAEAVRRIIGDVPQTSSRPQRQPQPHDLQ